MAATPAAAARRIKFRLLVRNANRFPGPVLSWGIVGHASLQHIANSELRDMPSREVNQKLNVACKSSRRLAEEPGENGPPCRELETPNSREPNTAFGFAAFTLLKTLRTPTPSTRL